MISCKGASASPLLKKLNLEVARGEGSRRFRDKDKGNGGGGTWANYEALNPVHAMPETNFNPTGTDASVPLYRANVEEGPYVIKDEACYRCGIKCHKNVYDRTGDGKAGKFRAKLDFEPLCLLSSSVHWRPLNSHYGVTQFYHGTPFPGGRVSMQPSERRRVEPAALPFRCSRMRLHSFCLLAPARGGALGEIRTG